MLGELATKWHSTTTADANFELTVDANIGRSENLPAADVAARTNIAL